MDAHAQQTELARRVFEEFKQNALAISQMYQQDNSPGKELTCSALRQLITERPQNWGLAVATPGMSTYFNPRTGWAVHWSAQDVPYSLAYNQKMNGQFGGAQSQSQPSSQMQI